MTDWQGCKFHPDTINPMPICPDCLLAMRKENGNLRAYLRAIISMIEDGESEGMQEAIDKAKGFLSAPMGRGEEER